MSLHVCQMHLNLTLTINPLTQKLFANCTQAGM